MSTAVVDTNVILVANNAHKDASPECVLECIRRLESLMASGTVAVDDRFRILLEYQRKTFPRRAKGVGDIFVKWVLSMMGDPNRVHQVALRELAEDCFAEFPAADLEEHFDRPDRKFVAVANAHPEKPPIWQASDCKWLDWWKQLAANSVTVTFLCGEDVCRFYRKKFPTKELPSLP